MAVVPRSYIYGTASGVAEGFVLPEAKIDPQGDWEQSWGVFCIRHSDGKPFPSGRLKIRRQAGSDGTARLTIDYRKLAAKDIFNRTQAEVECRVDSLSTPLNWTMRCFTEDGSGKVIGHELSSKGDCKKDHVYLKDSCGRRSKALSGDRTTLWTLFDAVQRLPRKDFDPLQFTFLDDFDQVMPGHSLSFRKAEEFQLKVKGKSDSEKVATRVYGYDHLGAGIVPMTYYVAEDGRLLFVLAGIDTFVLESEKGA